MALVASDPQGLALGTLGWLRVFLFNPQMGVFMSVLIVLGIWAVAWGLQIKGKK